MGLWYGFLGFLGLPVCVGMACDFVVIGLGHWSRWTYKDVIYFFHGYLIFFWYVLVCVACCLVTLFSCVFVLVWLALYSRNSFIAFICRRVGIPDRYSTPRAIPFKKQICTCVLCDLLSYFLRIMLYFVPQDSADLIIVI